MDTLHVHTRNGIHALHSVERLDFILSLARQVRDAPALAEFADAVTPVLRDLLTNNLCQPDSQGRCSPHNWTDTTARCPYQRLRNLVYHHKISL